MVDLSWLPENCLLSAWPLAKSSSDGMMCFSFCGLPGVPLAQLLHASEDEAGSSPDDSFTKNDQSSV